MRLSSYLLSAQTILAQYTGDIPFAAWLKNFFRLHKKFGSKDRKAIADLCFCFFRLGHSFANDTVEERLLIAQFLSHLQSPFIQELKPEWAEKMNLPPGEKLGLLDSTQQQQIFPFEKEVSPQIDLSFFSLSFLQQPDLFLRIRPGKETQVLKKIQDAGIEFSKEGDALRLPINTKADEVLHIDEEVVVQDRSSQQVLTPLLAYRTNKNLPFTAWDCCAASGGKTILLHDTYPAAKLTVSDIRESILANLKNRLKRAGIQHYRSFVADISRPHFLLPQTVDLVLCDAPCSGSGTWARTPEQLVFFKKGKIDDYALLQKNIARNAAKSLKQGGYFLYITCSVFQKENEDVVSYLQQEAGLQPLSQTYFKGCDSKADTLFAALFTTS